MVARWHDGSKMRNQKGSIGESVGGLGEAQLDSFPQTQFFQALQGKKNDLASTMVDVQV